MYQNLTEKQIKEKNEQQIKNSIDKYWQKNEALLNSEGIKKLNNSSENLTKFDKSIKEQQIKLNKNKKNDIIERIKEIDSNLMWKILKALILKLWN